MSGGTDGVARMADARPLPPPEGQRGVDGHDPAPLVPRPDEGVIMESSAEAEIRELEAITALCRELAQAGGLAGLGVQLRDAVPRMELITPAGVVVDVRVDSASGEFVWRPSFERHRVTDVPGAARALVAFLRQCHDPVFGREPR
jgi:hypothetical protein